jgi:hypothetical protein
VASAPSGWSRAGRQRHQGLGLASGGHAAASRAEGGQQWHSRGTREAEVGEASAVEVRDEAAASSNVGDDNGRRQRCGGVSGDRRAKALGGFENLLSVARGREGTEILGHGYLGRCV